MTTQGIAVAENSGTPATPASGFRTLYPKANGWHDLDSAGASHAFVAPDANGVAGVAKPGETAGLYLVSISAANAVIGGGTYWNGAAWVATDDTASTINVNASGQINITVDTGLTPAAIFTPTLRASLTSAGVLNVTGSYQVAGTKVVGTRVTGWTAATGTPTRSTFATGSVTLPQLAERVKALIDDLISHGLIGA